MQNVLTSKIRQEARSKIRKNICHFGQDRRIISSNRISSACSGASYERSRECNRTITKYIQKDHLSNSSGLFISLLYKIVGWLRRCKPSLSNLSAYDLLRSIYRIHDLRSRQLDNQLFQFAHELSYSMLRGVLSGSQRSRTKDL